MVLNMTNKIDKLVSDICGDNSQIKDRLRRRVRTLVLDAINDGINACEFSDSIEEFEKRILDKYGVKI